MGTIALSERLELVRPAIAVLPASDKTKAAIYDEFTAIHERMASMSALERYQFLSGLSNTLFYELTYSLASSREEQSLPAMPRLGQAEPE